MSTEFTKTPNIVARLVEVMAADGPGSVKLAESVSKAVASIGMALGAAGVKFGGDLGGGTSLGALAVDMKLPAVAIAAATELDGGGRSRALS